MAKNNRKLRTVYPEEKEGRVKDANKKLKSQIRNLKKTVRHLESENRTLARAFDKSCDFIQNRLENRSLSQILKMIDEFDYKETEIGREQVELEKIEIKAFEAERCPDCNKDKKEGFAMLDLGSFIVRSCGCGFKSKVSKSEGIERS